MEPLDFSRSTSLNNVPKKKLLEVLSTIENGQDSIQDKHIKLLAINRYAESNIPVEYWTLKMDRDFVGDPRLLEKYNEYVSDLKKSYVSGASICFAGSHGLGKTMTVTCILKKASQKGYSCLYTTLSDIVSVLTNNLSNEEKYLARKELVMVDFLVIDEFDSRFMPSENAADLYARSLESVFRTRSQNKLPTLMCTNSPNVVESFNGPLKSSIDSLMKGYLKVFPVFGEDFRKKRA
jgi:DNA replication protein DnaC